MLSGLVLFGYENEAQARLSTRVKVETDLLPDGSKFNYSSLRSKRRTVLRTQRKRETPKERRETQRGRVVRAQEIAKGNDKRDEDKADKDD